MAEERILPEPARPEPAAEGSASLGGLVADVVRKAVLTGVGALFLTEESARRLAREWKLPKDLATYLVAQAQGAKEEVLRIVSAEIRRFLQSEAFRREIESILSSMTLEVNAEIRLKEAGGRARTRVSVKPASHRRSEPEGEER